MVIFSEIKITEKECVKERYPHSKAKIRLVQHCAAISAIAEHLYSAVMFPARMPTKMQRWIVSVRGLVY